MVNSLELLEDINEHPDLIFDFEFIKDIPIFRLEKFLDDNGWYETKSNQPETTTRFFGIANDQRTILIPSSNKNWIDNERRWEYNIEVLTELHNLTRKQLIINILES